MSIKKIVIIGPESTGKSTLCAMLAKHYNTTWVPEYAREFLEKNGSNYVYDDLLKIAKGQIAQEENGIQEVMHVQKDSLSDDNFSSKIFIDTDMYVMKVWCEFVFDQCHNWILNQIANRQYDAYLLCDVDLPWVKDELREYPDFEIRKRLFYFYKEAMISQNTPWCIISGNYDQRLKKAIDFVDKMV